MPKVAHHYEATAKRRRDVIVAALREFQAKLPTAARGDLRRIVRFLRSVVVGSPSLRRIWILGIMLLGVFIWVCWPLLGSEIDASAREYHRDLAMFVAALGAAILSIYLARRAGYLAAMRSLLVELNDSVARAVLLPGTWMRRDYFENAKKMWSYDADVAAAWHNEYLQAIQDVSRIALRVGGVGGAALDLGVRDSSAITRLLEALRAYGNAVVTHDLTEEESECVTDEILRASAYATNWRRLAIRT